MECIANLLRSGGQVSNCEWSQQTLQANNRLVEDHWITHLACDTANLFTAGKLRSPYKLSDFVPFPAPRQPHELCLIGLRLDPTAEGPQLFALIEQRESGGRTIMANGRILFFSVRPWLPAHFNWPATRIAGGRREQTNTTSAPMPKADGCFVRRRAESVLVNSQTDDSDGVLLDCIACLDDLLRATELNVPANYIAVLNALAERLEQQLRVWQFSGGAGNRSRDSGRRNPVVRGRYRCEEHLDWMMRGQICRTSRRSPGPAADLIPK